MVLTNPDSKLTLKVRLEGVAKRLHERCTSSHRQSFFFKIMDCLCYIDESGTPQIPGNTSHYVLAGLSIPIGNWKKYDNQIQSIKKKYGLEKEEIHTAWILRPYLEQTKIPDFDSLDYEKRRREVNKQRLINIQALTKKKSKLLSQTKKNYKKTEAYIHLSYAERKSFILEIAKALAGWKEARLFAECIDKVSFNPAKSRYSVDEQAFEQVVSRFETFLHKRSTSSSSDESNYGILIHDNNETEARKLTDLMKSFHKKGTFWVKLRHIIETPLFVNSELTSMVQIADLCAFALRRYLENGEEELFNLVFKRGDRDSSGRCVGIRHYTDKAHCNCKICSNHS